MTYIFFNDTATTEIYTLSLHDALPIYTELGVMATVESTCEECEGRRFQAAVLDYTLGGRNIAEVLAMSVDEAEKFFGDGDARTPAAHKVLDRLGGVGLGYLTLNRQST